MTGDHGSAEIAYFATLYHAGKFRANFNFEELGEFLRSSLLAMAAGLHRKGPLFTALEAFAAFGQYSTTSEFAVEKFHQAWSSPDRTSAVVDVCLNGLWASRPFDEQGELLRTHAEEAIEKRPGSHILHYRLAAGQRLCKHYDALRSMDTALRLLPSVGARGSHKEIQEQYLYERSAIKSEREIALWTSEQQTMIIDLKVDNAALRETVQTSTTRTIEVVALFIAAISFAVGSLQLTLVGTLSLRDRAILLGIFGLGHLLFALVIIGATWTITRVRRR